MPQYVALLKAFMDELGICRSPLVGHALGAVVALHLAISEPERVDRLAIVSLPLSDQNINLKALAAGKASLGGTFFKQPAEYGPVLSELDKTDKQAIDLSISSLTGLDLIGQLATLRVPTLVVHGGKDPIVVPPKDEFLPVLPTDGDNGSPGAVRAMLMSQARHFPMLEEASQFNRLLRDFLSLDVSDPRTLSTLELKEEWRRRMH
jgi:3-oxoadipate enol-lactonase